VLRQKTTRMRELSKAFLAIGIACFVVAAFGPSFLAWLYHANPSFPDWMPWMAIGMWLDRKWWILASIFFVTLSLVLRTCLRSKSCRELPRLKSFF
jgi:hypothetical protein